MVKYNFTRYAPWDDMLEGNSASKIGPLKGHEQLSTVEYYLAPYY
jgi:hypothetical protein